MTNFVDHSETARERESDQQERATSQAPPDGATPIKLAHVVFKTSRFADMVEWYKKVLFAHVAYANEELAFLTYDEEHHRLAFVNLKGLQDKPAGCNGLHHVAFTYANLEDLFGTYSRLKGMAILPIMCVNHGPTTSIYYADPDGNQLEFQVDNFDTLEQASDYFYSSEFAENPIGVDFDPDRLLQRLRSGEADASLKKRPNIGSRKIESIPLK
jgi:catechol 2,3-dioxygenase-like lactoylglutathione lyase family enzyme